MPTKLLPRTFRCVHVRLRCKVQPAPHYRMFAYAAKFETSPPLTVGKPALSWKPRQMQAGAAWAIAATCLVAAAVALLVRTLLARRDRACNVPPDVLAALVRHLTATVASF
jgi:hypothetical protein